MRARVVVVGEALWDFFPARVGERLRDRRVDARHVGGAPANVARTLARLGVDVALVAAVGDDELGRALIETLRDDGVDVRAITPVPARTGLTFVDLDPRATPETRRTFVGYRTGSADFLLTKAMIPTPLRARYVHVGSTSFARAPASEATVEAIHRARVFGAKLSIDVNLYRHLWSREADPARALAPWLEDADVVKVSEVDLRALGTDLESLHGARGDRLTILTRAERGAVARLGTRTVEHRGRARIAVDPTGAGDAFMAGVLAVLANAPRGSIAKLSDATVARALAVGASLGAQVVTKLGATTGLGACARERALAGPARRR